MKPLVRVQREAAEAMIQRTGLLAKPADYFREFFNGRLPTIEEKLVLIEQFIVQMTYLQVFANDLYTIEVNRESPFIRLTISRHDGQPCRDWKHLQQIKNELVGPEYEAVELFPAESRLIDTGNEYHMWVHSDAKYRFPFGWKIRRFVVQGPESSPSQAPAGIRANSDAAFATG